MRRLPTDASGGGRGGRSPAARPTARPAAVSRAAEPALRPGLTGTRRRKRWRGPYRPGGRPEERRGRGARDTEANIIPSAAETPRPTGTQHSRVAARAQRAHSRAMKPTPARGVEAEVRGHGERGARAATLKRGALREARRSVAPHLPRAGFFTPTLVREVPIRETNFWFLQASARACSSSRHAWAAGREYGGEAVKDRAGRGGAHGRARVRVRARPRARQRVRRRLSASRHGARSLQEAFSRGGTGTDLIKGSHAVDIFFSSAGQTAAWGRLVGRHRVHFRP